MIDSEMMQSFMETFIFLEKTMVPDGEGGAVARWKDGMQFRAAVRHDNTILAQQAEGQGTASTYTLLIPKGLQLAFPDVVRRASTGDTYQITSDSADSFTPSTSDMGLASVNARKWRLT